MISIILPTRRRPQYLIDFVDSVRRTVFQPENLEIVLVRDEDDSTLCPEVEGLVIRQVIGPPGRNMGELNQAGLLACSGEWVFLLNDDVLMKTAGWDSRLNWASSRYRDGICLIHVNDTLLRERLCVFPFISRLLALKYNFIESCYKRYRIDDHIEDIFLRLAALGENRIQYLPDVVVEHRNVTWVNGVPEYHSEQNLLARDAEQYEQLAENRQQVAVSIYREIRRLSTEDRISRINYAVQVPRNSTIVTVFGFSSLYELNNQIESSTSDFIWLPRNAGDKCPFTRPPELDYQRFENGIYLDRRKFSKPIFDARFKAFLFDLDLCIRHGIQCNSTVISWWFSNSVNPVEIYREDLALFRTLHPNFHVEDDPPPSPSLTQRVWKRWKTSGLLGLINSILNLIGRPFDDYWSRNASVRVQKER